MVRVLIMGPAGSGKDTQSYLISQNFNIPVISTGDLLRDKIAEGDELGNEIKRIISGGDLLSDEMMINMLDDRLQHEDCNSGYVLDGFPRTIDQAIAFEKILEERNSKSIDCVLVLEVPRDVVVKRISGRFQCAKCKKLYNKFFAPTEKDGVCDVCGNTTFLTRSDDLNSDAIDKRLNIYEAAARKIIDFYDKKNLIYFIDGVKTVKEISEEIKNILNNLNVN